MVGRQSNRRKTAAQERRLARFNASRLRMARFCDREGLLVEHCRL